MKRFLAISFLSVVFACGDNHEGTPDSPPGPACSDHIDNDGDGLIDFPKDPGCENPEDESEDSLAAPQCSDHRDNDADGKKDFPDDPGCANPLVDSEQDDCPNGAGCPQCSNGVDDDGDGAKDFPTAGCDSAADPIEFVENPIACGASLKIKHLPATGNDFGMLDATSTTSLPSSCGSASGVPAIAYLMVLTSPTVVVISTVGSTVDTVVDLRSALCVPDSALIACNDNVGGTDKSSKVTRSLATGAYYIVVKSKTTATGPYNLQVEFFAGEGATCTDTAQCGPGLVCRIPVGGTTKVCSKPVCSDGLDDDADGKIDYPNDPGCSNPSDADELDDCPNGPNCPDCADGLDNDGDSSTDYPLDTSCKAAGDASEACITSEPIDTIIGPTTMGDTTGAFDDYDPTCNSTGGLSPDLLYRVDLPALSSLTVNVNGFDTVHSLLDSSCGGLPIRCTDFNPMSVTNLAAGTYYLTVEGYFTTGVGPFTIDLSGIIAPGGACEGPLVSSGALSCGVGFMCDGPVGAKTCRNECTDGIDNNGDGKIDFPNDPGCGSPNDNTENTVCPGMACPACADGIDNDGDSLIDFPLDPSCAAAGGSSEACNGEQDPIANIVTGLTMSTMVGAHNDHTPLSSCTGGTPGGVDVLFTMTVPAMSTLRLSTENSVFLDTVMSVLPSTCAEPAIACDDDSGVTPTFSSLLNLTNFSAGTYIIAIDAYDPFVTLAPFVIALSGTIAPGGACEGVLATAGAITCSPGFVCDGTPGAKTCRTQCSDGVDNNGDGKIDYPNDPGCSSPSDNSETTVCPGMSCPACADGIDNDGDTLIDFPLDPSCVAAGGSSESCTTSEAILPITGTTTTGTTAGQVNDSKPSCGLVTHTAPDLLYQLDIPALQSLSLNLTFSPFQDGVVSLLDATCGSNPVACGDLQPMTASNLAAGRYFVVVDANGAASGPFTLTTTGVIAPGGSCESPLFTAGTLTCATGSTCQGAVGSRTCRTQCSDGIDNNGDGKIDFPNDPSCTSLIDNTEVTVCPGAGCPVCGNGIDEDADTTIDYPADVGCLSAAGGTEVFCSVEPDFKGSITTPVTLGTLASPAAGNYNQTCQSNTGHDVAYALVLPVPVRTLVVSTIGSAVADTVLAVKDATCNTSFGCNDDIAPGNTQSLLSLTNLASGTYSIQVDSYNANGGNNGPFKLNVQGTVGLGRACTSPLFASGVLACQTGSTCTAGICQ